MAAAVHSLKRSQQGLDSCTAHTLAPSPALPCGTQGNESDSGMIPIETMECREQESYLGSNPSSACHLAGSFWANE